MSPTKKDSPFVFQPPSVDEGDKNISRRSMRSEIDERDEDSKEPNNMEDQNHSFNLGKPPRQVSVDEYNESNHGVEYQRSLPPGRRIIGIVEDCESLNH